MNWKTIGEVFRVSSGGTPQSSKREYYQNGTIPWVNTGDLKTRYLTRNEIPKKITQLGLDNSSAKIFPFNTVLVAMYGASIGNAAILKTEAATNQACAALLPNEDFSEEFLYFYLLSIQKNLVSQGQGGGQPNISAEIIKRTKFPIVPLETQRQIVTVLDKAQSIIDKRKNSLRLLDQLLRDTFLDMFGDPVKNPKNYSSAILKDVITYGPQNGLYVPNTKYGNGTRILRIDSFYDGQISNLNQLKRIDIEQDIVSLYSLRENDIVINRVNSRKFLGKSAIVPTLDESVVFESNMMRISVDNKEINPYYLIFFLQQQYVKNQILNRAKDAVNQSSINQEDVKSLKILIPKLTEQNSFAEFFKKINEATIKVEKAKSQSETLFQSLLQKAYKGELEFSTNAEEHIEKGLPLTRDLPVSKPLELKTETTTSFEEEEEETTIEQTQQPSKEEEKNQLNAFFTSVEKLVEAKFPIGVFSFTELWKELADERLVTKPYHHYDKSELKDYLRTKEFVFEQLRKKAWTQVYAPDKEAASRASFQNDLSSTEGEIFLKVQKPNA